MKELQGIRITTGNRETGAKAPVDALRPSKEALSSKKESSFLRDILRAIPERPIVIHHHEAPVQNFVETYVKVRGHHHDITIAGVGDATSTKGILPIHTRPDQQG